MAQERSRLPGPGKTRKHVRDERSREEPRRRDAARAEGAERTRGCTRAKRAVQTRVRVGGIRTAAATRPAPKARSGPGDAPERSERCRHGFAWAGQNSRRPGGDQSVSTTMWSAWAVAWMPDGVARTA